MAGEGDKRTVISLLVGAVLALLAGPVIMLMGAFSVNASFIGGALLVIGALGLYAGMKALDRKA